MKIEARGFTVNNINCKLQYRAMDGQVRSVHNNLMLINKEKGIIRLISESQKVKQNTKVKM